MADGYDIFDPEYIENPFPAWEEMRGCPIAHTDLHQGSWNPTKYDDVVALARMVPELSSNDMLVMRPPIEESQSIDAHGYHVVNAPPISSDPPIHSIARRIILPAFSPAATETHRPFTQELARNLAESLLDSDTFDAATNFAQQIPPRVIAHILGVDENDADQFIEWVRWALELGATDPVRRRQNSEELQAFFDKEVADRRANPGDDMITVLTKATLPDGSPLSDEHITGTCNLLLIAGIDTTWSSIGSAIWHLATHPQDQQMLRDRPEIMPLAVEELLRAYSPVTMARLVREQVEYGDVTFQPGDKVLMNFPAANRDPDQFENADKVILDRERNRHIAFGIGIHRCAGSNLARMEMTEALTAFMNIIPPFELDGETTWAGGQVRGPRKLELKLA